MSVEEGVKRESEQMKRHEADPNEGATYLFLLPDGSAIDGNVPANVARYINHSCEPNCEIEFEENRVHIVAIKDIEEGCEVTYNYGFDLENYLEYPCRCGSDRCVGYICDEDDWQRLHELEKKRKKQD